MPAHPMPHSEALVVLTTVATDDEAVRLIRGLLDRRLIACGTLVPGARSLYRWQGRIADEREVFVLLKTRSARLEPLQAAFAELHPYKVPELLALPVSAGLDRYLEWITGETALALT
jgi:periplasmic divalent cation tolerance protein